MILSEQEEHEGLLKKGCVLTKKKCPWCKGRLYESIHGQFCNNKPCNYIRFATKNIKGKKHIKILLL